MHNAILLTSIPPSLRGIPFASAAQISLQRDAINSWRDLGATIISLNTARELAAHPELSEALADAGVQVLTAASSAFTDDYSHLPSVRRSLEDVASLYPDHFILFVNADIVVSRPQSLVRSLDSFSPGHSFLAHRNDICALQSSDSSGTPYLGGYDFFACYSSTLLSVTKLLPDCLTFALPWWDLYFALALRLSSSSVSLIDHAHFSHVIHNDRWATKSWKSIGNMARRQFVANFQVNRSIAASIAEESQLKAILALTSGHPSSVFTRSRLKRRLKSLVRTRGWQPIHLHELSDAIISYLRLSCTSV